MSAVGDAMAVADRLLEAGTRKSAGQYPAAICQLGRSALDTVAESAV
jgi:hypothetical protein